MFFHFTKPNKKYSPVDLPFEFMDKKKMIEAFMAKNKKNIEENMELVKLKGCPDLNLLETGKYSETCESSSFDEKKKIDELN